MKTSPEERFLAKVNIEAPNGCWEWTGALIAGYGRFAEIRGKNTRAHRFSFELFRGPIPEGLVLDHLCRNKKCVNPAHLDPCTIVENLNRGIRTNANAKQTHCIHGHEFAENNIIWDRGKRKCRECSRVRCLKRYYELKSRAS